MFTTRVDGSPAPIQDFVMPHDPELLSVYPPPRTPNLPATAGSARIAAAAFPPFRFRSSPHPQRITAGDAAAYLRARSAMASGSSPATAAARSKVHSRARARKAPAPVVCASRKASSASPFSKRWRCRASATATSVPGLGARCRSAWRANGVARGSTTTSAAPARCASRMYGTRWMPDAEGFAPQTTMSFACA